MTTFLAIAKYVSIDQLGMISICGSIFSVLYLIFQLESKPYVIGNINNANADLSRFVYIIQLSSMVSITVLFISVFYSIFIDFNIIVVVACIGSSLVGTLNFAKWVNEGEENFTTTLIIDISTNLLTISCKLFIVYYNLDWKLLLYIIIIEFLLIGSANYICISKAFKARLKNSFNLLGLNEAKKTVKDIAPLIIAGIAVILYSRLDLLMLGKICGAHCAGEYTLVMRFSELLVIPTTIIVTFTSPRFLNTETRYPDFYRKYSIILEFTILVSLICFVILAFVMNILYQLASVETPKNITYVYSVLGFAFVIASLGMVSSIYINKINKRSYLAERCVWGLLCNIALNILLIPPYGTLGAAVSTLISQLISALIFDLCKYELRENFKLKIRSILISPIRCSNTLRAGFAELNALRS